MVAPSIIGMEQVWHYGNCDTEHEYLSQYGKGNDGTIRHMHFSATQQVPGTTTEIFGDDAGETIAATTGNTAVFVHFKTDSTDKFLATDQLFMEYCDETGAVKEVTLTLSALGADGLTEMAIATDYYKHRIFQFQDLNGNAKAIPATKIMLLADTGTANVYLAINAGASQAYWADWCVPLATTGKTGISRVVDIVAFRIARDTTDTMIHIRGTMEVDRGADEYRFDSVFVHSYKYRR